MTTTSGDASAPGPTSNPAPATQFFFELTPDRVLHAVESAGFVTTGRCSALNSFENRVYDVELEDDNVTAEERRKSPWLYRRVIKFYRPGRWTPAQILEEHEFLRDLQQAEVPAIAPLAFPDGSTLKLHGASGIRYAIFPKVGGRAPDELDADQCLRIGRLLARIHNVGAEREARNRVRIHPATYGLQSLDFLVKGGYVPLEFQKRYIDAVEKICMLAAPLFDAADTIRLHGDCHLGNLLWNAEGPFFLDFDDMVTGPAVQDLWLLLPGRPEENEVARARLVSLLDGYEEMRKFDRSSLRLVEPLRALRYVHYSAWVARRWEDPAFPLAFPEFGTHRYWSDETRDLEQQLAWMDRGDGLAR